MFFALPPFYHQRRQRAALRLVHGFNEIFREQSFDFVVAFLITRTDFSRKIYKEYKAHRPPTPNELIEIKEAHELFNQFGIKHLVPSFEADDLIARR